LNAVLVLAVVLPWVLIALETWLLYLFIRRHGRTLLNQEEFRDRLAAIERALQTLSAAQTSGAPDAHDHAAPEAPAGLPIGTPAPAFALPDLSGRERKLDDYLGKPLLVAFFSPTCGFCLEMAPRLGQVPVDGSRVLLVSTGKGDELNRLAQENKWRFDVVLEQGQVSGAYRIGGTPMGYLLDSEGRIASDLAVGADAVLNLLSHGKDGLTAESLRAKEAAAAERMRAAGLAIRQTTINRQGLPAGTAAPDFTLHDLNGAQRSLQQFRGKRVLLVFSDAACGPCDALAPDLVRLYEQQRGSNVEVVMVSRGGAEANRAKVEEHGFTFPVLLQNHWEVSKEYAMFATPVGYLIDEKGVIAKGVAVGGEAILQLV